MMKAMYWIISAAVTLAGIGVMSVGAAQLHKENEAAGESRTETFTAVKDMEIALGAAQVTVLPDEKAEEVSVSLTNPPKDLVLKEENGKLILKNEENVRFGFLQFGDLFEKAKFEAVITVPADTELGEVAFSLGSGSGLIQSQTMRDLELELGSGSMELCGTTVSANTAVSVGSGNVKLTDAAFGTVHYEAGSGSLTLEGADITENLELFATSGNIKGDTLRVGGVFDLQLASGTLRIDDVTPGASTQIELASGSMELGLTGKQEDYTFNSTTASGRTTIGEQSGKELFLKGGEKQVTSEVASGSLKITFTE